MFSRSEKTEEVAEAMLEPSDEQRSPMVLAALAGLLAIAGAFLLVWYLSNNSSDPVADSNSPAIVNEDGTIATNTNTGDAGDQPTRQVLVVTQTIPEGTSVNELIAAPTVYLSARAVPEQFVTASAITSVAELQELEGQVLASDILAGEQLLRGRFRNPSDFNPSEGSALDNATLADVPPGHHAVVLDLPATRALNGVIDAGDLVTVIANFRVSPEGNRAGREVSVVVLNQAEVVGTAENLEVAGEFGSFDQRGTTALGTVTVSLAVLPEELTDLTYAIEFGELLLATAVDGLDNEGPRGITTMRQLAGDDGIWVGELEDGNIVELVEIFPPEAGFDSAGTSIEVEIAPDADDRLGDEPLPADDNADLLGEGESDG